MSEYQVLARRYRPKTFSDVLGQAAICTTLLNAIKQNRIAHAYLFSGPRGTGKTSIARIFAKALNCLDPTEMGEPCSKCASCTEITSGNCLDVLEIDGASHRGIEEIRRITETAGYASASGKYKIYIIDEVHMLTKEAFNALLKTLEEPPPGVKFFFATTEPHKVIPTILSRCQQFHLRRIDDAIITKKLESITKELELSADLEALQMISKMAEGGLRDAESLLDQVIAFHDGSITEESVASILGMMSRDIFFELDEAGQSRDYAKAFEIAHKIFSEGKDLTHFVEGLVQHFRNILLVHLYGKQANLIALPQSDRQRYLESIKIYHKEQCMSLLDELIEEQQKIRFAPCAKTSLECILLRILRSHNRLPLSVLVKRLTELESKISEKGTLPPLPPTVPAPKKEPEPIVNKTPTHQMENLLQTSAVMWNGRLTKP